MHEGDRSDAANRFGDRCLGFLRCEPAGLQPKQRRDGLQVVLDPMVDLANGGVFREQQPIASTQLGDIAQHQHATGDFAVFDDRDTSRQQGDIGVLVELFDDRFAAFVGLPN